MAATSSAKPQAFLSEFAPRLRSHMNALLTPVLPTTTVQPGARLTKRGTAIISYAEGLDDDDFEDSDTPRRLTGLRSRRELPPDQNRDALVERLSKELTAPVETQGIWRDWFAKPSFGKSVQ
jgi:chromatin structure-remodeling complex subunit SFH1